MTSVYLPPAALPPRAAPLVLAAPAELAGTVIDPLEGVFWPLGAEAAAAPPASPLDPALDPVASVPLLPPAAEPEGALPKTPPAPPELGVIPPFKPAELLAPLTPPMSVGPPLPAELAAPLTVPMCDSPGIVAGAVPLTVEPEPVAAPAPRVEPAPSVEPSPSVSTASDPRLRMNGCAGREPIAPGVGVPRPMSSRGGSTMIGILGVVTLRGNRMMSFGGGTSV